MSTSNLFRVDGMVAVVTGGGTGIGFIMAKALANAGAERVYILSQRKAVLEEAAATHASLRPLVCDVGSKTSLQAAVDVVAAEAGHVNLVIANAGIVGPVAGYKGEEEEEGIAGLRKRLFDGVDMEDFTRTMHVNVTGAYFTMLAFLELLDEGNKRALKGGFGAPIGFGDGAAGGKGGGGGGKDVPSIQSQVLFTSSVSAYSRAGLTLPAYAGSKSAIAHLAKHASSNLAPYGIRVNVIAPGLFPSVLAAGMIQGRDPSKEHPSEQRFVPARRFGGEEEMAGTVLYLASRAGSYCNGLVLVNDGGKLSVMPSEY